MIDEIKLLVNGKAAFDSILDRIKKAKKSIKINMFIWRDDYIGNLLANEILNAADRGVMVTISKDKLGCLFELAEENMASFFNKNDNLKYIVQAKVLAAFYKINSKNKKTSHNPLFDRIVNHENIDVSYNINKGDHSKYYIFDDEVLIMGGVNIEDKELTHDMEGTKYHDYMIEFQGKKFVDLFIGRMNLEIPYSSKSHIEFILNKIQDNIKVLDVKNKLLDLLDGAASSVEIIMAYLGDEDIEDKIVDLANKGLEITLIVPEKSNLQNDLNFYVLKRLYLRTQEKISIYLSPNMIHAKLIRVDKTIITLGSTNLNKNAMYHLSELNTIIRKDLYNLNEELNVSLRDQINISRRVTDVDQLKFNKVRVFIEKLF